MEKEPNPRFWQVSCLLFEAIKRSSKNKTTIKDEIAFILKNKKYDNLSYYAIIML